MNVIKNNEIDKTQWYNFVKDHPKGNLFQTPDMYDVYQKTKGYTPQVIAIEQNKQIVGILLWVVIAESGIKSYFSKRSIIQGAPLAKNDNEDIIVALLNEYEECRDKRIIYTQIRNHYEMLTVNDAFQQCGYRFSSHLNFIISLDDENKMWERISKGRIKQIKKAQKNGLIVDVYEPKMIDDNVLEQSYDVLKSIYTRIGLPLVGIDQIKAINEKGLLVIFMVKTEQGDVLGCRLGLINNDSIYGWYAGSYSQYYNLFPNDILIWETLRWGLNNNYKTFDYGGAGEPNKKYGVRAFKQQMGGELVNYGRYENIHRKFMFQLGKIGLNILRLLK